LNVSHHLDNGLWIKTMKLMESVIFDMVPQSLEISWQLCKAMDDGYPKMELTGCLVPLGEQLLPTCSCTGY
jgi:hypothetical protein